MRIIAAADLADVLAFPELIEALRSAFRSGVMVPLRHVHDIPLPDQADAKLMLMPAWSDFGAQGHSDRGYVGIKIIAAFPDNPGRQKATISGVYLLMSGKSGEPLALIDGSALTNWRTAAASALASSYLARQDAGRLLMLGAGSLAPYLVDAHAAVRPIRHVLIWNRTAEAASHLAARMRGRPFAVEATEDLEGAMRGADIVSAATASADPIVRGDWISGGTHVDLVGAHSPETRESDDLLVERARIFVDTRAGALAEAGDVLIPMHAGLIQESDIAADLAELTRGEKAGRRFHDQITMFKSVGTGLEDLAAAIHVFART